MNRVDELLQREAESVGYPLLFATISGAHLYGFPSPDSDYDLRAVHILPLEEVVGLLPPREQVERTRVVEGVEMDVVSHDVKPFFNLLLKKNGNALEQTCSPLVVRSSPEHEELKSLIPGCVTRFHCHHYLGFADSQWKQFQKEPEPKIKPLLYVYRVLLTGIHMMRTGEVQPNLRILAEEYGERFLLDLVDEKIAGHEHGALSSNDLQFYEGVYARFRTRLEEEADRTHLPHTPSSPEALHDLLVRIRLKGAAVVQNPGSP